jgi:uncharacterized protein (UPF0303 family)
MSKADDIKLIIEQEKALVFPEFSEEIAFRIGSALRETAIANGHGIAAEIRTGDRPLFYMALPGSTADNPHWLRRKANVVHRLYKASYRVVLEHTGPDDFFGPRRGLDNMDYVLAGGGFPIWVKHAGMIGSLCVSGLHERDDHRLAVDAIADHLGVDKKALTLPPL